MWNDIYRYLLLIVIVVTFVFGLALLLIKIPQSQDLKKYGTFRMIAAFTYLSLCAVNLLEILSQGGEVNIRLARCLTLSMGVLQAFLLTYSYLTLLNPSYITHERITCNLVHVFIITLVTFSSYLFPDNTLYFNWTYTTMSIYYVFMMIWYTYLFLKIYKQYLYKVDNFYSETEFVRMRWVYISFFASLLVGVFSVVSVIFIGSIIATVIFSAYVIVFYSYYGVRFINYPFRFHFIAPLLKEQDKSDKAIKSEEDKKYVLLEVSIQQWIGERKFKKSGITIEEVARQLGTNRTYLSNYINKEKNQTFRNWIHGLRIENSKQMLTENPLMCIEKLAHHVGYNDCDSFHKQFEKQTGMTVNAWKDGKSII